MIIEKLLENNISKILTIEKNLFPNPWGKEDFEFMLLKSEHNFILKDDDVIVGYFCSLVIDKIVHITNFAIVKKFQNKGLGTYFFKVIAEIFNQYGNMTFFLEVRNANKKAIYLYEKLGFKVVDVIKNYYKNPKEDAFLMIKYYI